MAPHMAAAIRQVRISEPASIPHSSPAMQGVAVVQHACPAAPHIEAGVWHVPAVHSRPAMQGVPSPAQHACPAAPHMAVDVRHVPDMHSRPVPHAAPSVQHA